MSLVELARRAARPRLRLYCLPYAGRGASMYSTWIGAFGPEVEVCPLQLPGRETRLRERSFHEMQELVASVARSIEPELDVPYAVFGHSMGALVSFELARHVVERGRPGPAVVFTSAAGAPPTPRAREDLHLASDEELVRKLRELKGTPEAVLENAELLEILLPIFRADLAVVETYACDEHATIEAPLVAFGGDEDDEAPFDSLLRWRDRTRGAFGLRMFRGGHYFVHSARDAVVGAVTHELANRGLIRPVSRCA
jgi:medium-chain acyl-[acyl-carrier-protein] hydrolase